MTTMSIQSIQFDSIYILSQIITILALALLVWTYFITNRNKQLYIIISSNLFYIMSMLLLGGYTGAATIVIAIVRDITSKIIYENRPPEARLKNTRFDYYLLALWISLLSIVTYFTWNGFISLFAFAALALFTVSVWQKNQLFYRILGIVSAICWIIYLGGILNIAGVVSESILLAMIIVGLVKFLNGKKAG